MILNKLKLVWHDLNIASERLFGKQNGWCVVVDGWCVVVDGWRVWASGAPDGHLVACMSAL